MYSQSKFSVGSTVCLFLKKMGFNNIKILRKKIAKMSNGDVNKLMVSLLSFNEASEMMIDSCKDIVRDLSGNEILVQRRLNTIFNYIYWKVIAGKITN